MKKFIFSLISILLFCSVIPAEQKEVNKKYMAVFAYEPERLPNPGNSHVFACWFCPKEEKGFTISWYGEKPIPGVAQNGVNLSLKETYERAAQYKLTIYKFGPYECKNDFYENADKFRESLKKYKFLDKLTLTDGTKNCIRAVADSSGKPCEGLTGRWGKDAAREIVKNFMKTKVIENKETNSVWDDASKKIFKLN
jgi:hypothetical protein